MIRQVILAGKVAINSATKLYTWKKYTWTTSWEYKTYTTTENVEQTITKNGLYYGYGTCSSDHSFDFNDRECTIKWVSSQVEWVPLEGFWPRGECRDIGDIKNPTGWYYSERWGCFCTRTNNWYFQMNNTPVVTLITESRYILESLQRICASTRNDWRNVVVLRSHDCKTVQNINGKQEQVKKPSTEKGEVTSYNPTDYPNRRNWK